MKRYVILGCLVMMVSACASKPSKEVPIESRPAEAQAAAVSSASADKAAGVETRALGNEGVEGKSLQSADKSPANAMNTAPMSGAVNRPAKKVLHFDYDSSALKGEEQVLVEQHATYLKANKAQKVILQGHTDERGSREYNLALGQRRADAVKQAFSVLGVQADAMESVSLGEEKPVSDGHDEAAWAQNRRVELLYKE